MGESPTEVRLLWGIPSRGDSLALSDPNLQATQFIMKEMDCLDSLPQHDRRQINVHNNDKFSDNSHNHYTVFR